MNNILYDYLRTRFYQSNISKCRKYFEEWVSNLTATQIEYFEIERLKLIER